MTPILYSTHSRNAVRSLRRGRRKRLRGIERLEERALLATFTVNSLLDTIDANPGDGIAQDAAGQTTLRAAIMEANARAGDDTVLLGAGMYALMLGGTDEDAAVTGDLDVAPNGRLTIMGAGAGLTIIDGGGLDRVFHVLAFTHATFSGLTVRNGASTGDGGGVLNAGTLTIGNSILVDNTADRGGGIANVGTLTIDNTTLTGNSANGGGIFNGGGTATVTNSTIAANTGSAEENSAGGAYNQSGMLVITGSTISTNSASLAGGIWNQGELTLKHSTVAANTATLFEGGPANRSGGVVNSSSGNMTVQNSIVADNSVVGVGVPDFSGAPTSLGNNLIGDTTGSSGWMASDVQNVDPLIGPLADNGGPTQTHELLAGSPAVDAGENAGAPATDQRGAPFVRIFNGTVDIGAYERQAFSFVVDTAADENDGNYAAGDLSLREAILLTNSNPGHETIQFAQSLAGGVFGGGGIALSLGELSITDDLAIMGLGDDRLGISGNNNSRLFNIASGTTVEIAGLMMRNGRAAEGGAIQNEGTLTIRESTISGSSATISGGGVHNTGTLTIVDSTLSDNEVSDGTNGRGGGIANFGELTLENAIISANTAASLGGGIYNAETGTLSLIASTVENNTATGFLVGIRGGGLYNLGSATIMRSTLSGNSVSPEGSSGGGIYNQAGMLTVINSTISGNSGNQTGGIFNNAELTITHSTVTANATNMFFGPPSPGSGGIANSASGTVAVQNTIIANNIAGTAGGTPDYFGMVNSLGNNLIGDTAGSSGWVASDLQNVDSQLSSLAENGGSTKTHALLPASPAIDAGNNAGAPLTDQRGEPFDRVANGKVDIGAYESQPLTFVVDTAVDENDGTYTAGDVSLREAIVLTSGNPGRDIIEFTSALEGSTITLTLGELLVTGDLTVTGLGADRIAVSGNNASRVFNIGAGATVEIFGLTIRSGKSSGNGGGILNSGALTIIDCTIANNSAPSVLGQGGLGGGIYNSASGRLTIVGSTISGNSVGGFPGLKGGGIYNTGILQVTDSAIIGNSAAASVPPPCTICGSAGAGGGLYNESGTVSLTNTTFSGNTAAAGAIHNVAQMIIKSSTIANNHVLGPRFGPGGTGGVVNGGTLTLQNTIIAQNVSTGFSPDFAGAALSLGNNLIGIEGTSTGWIESDLRNVDPRLGPLADNGGPTMTHALLPDSPAIDAGNNADAPATDQRGIDRPQDGNDDGIAVSDIGSFEFTVPTLFRVRHDTFSVADDMAAILDVLANDTPPRDHTLSITMVTQSEHGAVTIAPGGESILYTSQPNFNGSDTFRYTVTASDGQTAVANVTVNVVSADPDFVGTAGDDVYLLRRDAAGQNIEVLVNDTGAGMPIFSAPIDFAVPFLFETLDGNDRLIMDWIHGNPFPAGGIEFRGGNVSAAADALILRTVESAGASYAPDPSTAGSGIVASEGREIRLTGVEQVHGSGLGSLTVITPRSNDALRIANLTAETMQLSGTSGGIPLPPVTFSDETTFIIDAAAHDADHADDTLTIAVTTEAPDSSGFLQFHSGSGTNSIVIQSQAVKVDGAVGDQGTLTTTVPQGARLVTHRLRQTSLIVNEGARATVLPDGTDASTSVLNNLILNGNGTLDLNDNALILDYSGDSPLAAIRAKLFEGRGGGGIGLATWGWTGIVSSAAQEANAAEPDVRSIGYAENATMPLGSYTNFRGQPVDDTAVLMAYTRTADANLDGVVGDEDVTIVGATYAPGVPQPHWALGDFDYNDFVDDTDVTLLGALYDPTAAPLEIPPTATALNDPRGGKAENSAERLEFFAALATEQLEAQDRLQSRRGRSAPFGMLVNVV